MKSVNPCLPILLTLITLTSLPAAYVRADDDIFKTLGRLFDRAIGNDEPADDVMRDKNPGRDLPGEKDIEEYKNRLQIHRNALQHWLIVTGQLSEPQQTAITKIIDEQILSSTKMFSETPDSEGRQQIFPMTFPMMFTVGGIDRSGPPTAVDFSQQVLTSIRNELLDAEQQARIDAALKERENFHHQAFVKYLVAQVDEELFLTAEQRTNVSKAIAARTPPVSHPLYMFNPQSYYLPYESMSVILSNASVGQALNANQKKRLQDLNNADPNSQHLIFQSGTGRDGWYNQMNEAGLKERQKFLNAAAVRVAYYQQELQLSPEQAEYLTSASKGAAVRAVNDWKESTEQIFVEMEQQMAQMGGDFGFGASNMDARSIEENSIWKDALSTCSTSEVRKVTSQRKAARQKATADSVLALLDHELWLLPEQRARLTPLILKSMPQGSEPFQYQEYIREIILIAHPLFRVPEKSRNEILNEPQQEAWQQLQSYFQLQKEQNYVEIPLRNNGGSFGFSLTH